MSEALDRFLPRFEWRTDLSLPVRCSAERAFATLVDESHSDGVITMLLRMRGMAPRENLRSFFGKYGFILLEEKGASYLVYGLLGKPWLPSGGGVPCPAAPLWPSMTEGEHAAVVAIFGVRSTGPGQAVLYTETRIHVADPRSRLKFGTYWFFVKPFSNILRYQWLRSAKQKAEFPRIG